VKLIEITHDIFEKLVFVKPLTSSRVYNSGTSLY